LRWTARLRVDRDVPVNQPGSGAGVAGKNPLYFEERSAEDEDVIGLSFSGGGTRAAAFSFGVLTEMARTPVRGASASMLDRIGFISGISGGAVTAAYYGLRKRAALDDFRERFLLRNAEEGLETDLTIDTIGKAFAGGINDSRGFPRWLDANLFNGAAFGEFRESPRVWINASDIYSRTPFAFGATAFSAMCSDLSTYPLANAVAASAAVPVAFAPVVIKTFPTECSDPLPTWIIKARDDRIRHRC
jgi:NTE family protein